jgi:hypothetical protein
MKTEITIPAARDRLSVRLEHLVIALLFMMNT